MLADVGMEGEVWYHIWETGREVERESERKGEGDRVKERGRESEGEREGERGGEVGRESERGDLRRWGDVEGGRRRERGARPSQAAQLSMVVKL